MERVVVATAESTKVSVFCLACFGLLWSSSGVRSVGMPQVQSSRSFHQVGDILAKLNKCLPIIVVLERVGEGREG